jgi:hypothetical protein
MREMVVFLNKLILKYGILLFGLSWFLALGSRILFDRSEKLNKGKRIRVFDAYKERIYMGIRILVWGIVFSLIPFK